MEQQTSQDLVKTNTIYLVRHGENQANITKEFSYKKVDYPLTPKGVQQARQTALYFRDEPIHEVYASPLKRARETADIIAREHHLPVTIMEQFRELNLGELEDMPPTAENWALFGSVVKDWYNGRPETAFPGGENYHMALERVQEGLQEITHNKVGRNIVVVAHGGIVTVAVSGICQNLADVVTIETFKVNHNCSITRMELLSSAEKLSGTLTYWASHAHLSGEAALLVNAFPDK
ncbi:histidine phosphatase family protein [Ktedonosporobacter rubrisoli]|uniref:Histidine phosphatase family protein n=1 Tax=Ktedonosporobacter rubrisoli TaxID=2509675 RepID=A0A4P6JQZ9_KTERU|nr:histidine phosphatase family protein [Ktedonosporobacter rubrisoli]QBD77869.1 histidine phosphatase family protein [Ktedonosporobacter rubrisoli]